MTDGYRDRAFKIACAVSVVIHAGLIAFIPGFRTVAIEPSQVLDVQIVPTEPPVVTDRPVVTEKVQEPPKPLPAIQPPMPEPAPPQPIIRQSPPERLPEPARQAQPELPPPPRAEFIQTPRAEPKPEFVVPEPPARTEVRPEPRLETRPEPKIERQLEPPPIARMEPRPEPRPVPRVEPRPEPPPVPTIPPRQEARVEAKSLPREAPPPAAKAPLAPTLTAPAIERPAPPQAAVQPPPVVAPQPAATVAPPPDESRERMLSDEYRQIISAKIKRYEEYPVVAKRRHWEGTTVVQLSISPDGKIETISVVEKSGHEILDEAAVKMIRKAVPLPTPPEGLRTVLIPIKFRLDS